MKLRTSMSIWHKKRKKTLKEIIDNFESNLTPYNKVITGSGQLTNALNWNIDKLNSLGAGDLEQETTTGKNLDSNSNQEQGQYSNTDGAWQELTSRVTSDFIPVTNGNYTLSLNSSNNVARIVNIHGFDENKNWLGGRTLFGIDSALPNTTREVTLEVPSGVSYIRYNLGYYANDSANLTIQQAQSQMPQFELGSTATPYEKYTGGQASPNPDYEQPIKILSGNVSGGVNGKNFFKANGLSGYASQTSIASDGTIKIWGNSQSNGYRQYNALKYMVPELKAGDTVYLHFETDFTSRKYIFGDGGLGQWSNGQARTLTQSMLDGKIVLYGGYQATTTIKIMITKVKYESVYEAYKKAQTFPLTIPADKPLGNLSTAKNIFFKNTKDNPNYNRSLVENAWYFKKAWNKIDSYNGETITTTYMSTTGGLDTGATVCYVLNAVEYVQITDTTLINQLEAIANFMTHKNITNITIAGGDIDGVLDFDYFVDEVAEIKEQLADQQAQILELGGN